MRAPRAQPRYVPRPSLLVAGVALTPFAGDAGAELPRPASTSPPRAPAATADTTPPDLRVGVALSGGAARGLAHAGVLEVLEEAGIRVDAVAGTSIGAVVGGLYAAGHRTRGLDSIARAVDWSRLFSEDQRPIAALSGLPAPPERHQLALPLRAWNPALPSGLISGQRVTQLVSRLTWRVHDRASFLDLPVPFPSDPARFRLQPNEASRRMGKLWGGCRIRTTVRRSPRG